MASPRYDARYRKYDDAPGRVIAAGLLSPTLAAGEIGRHRSTGEVAVADQHYEPWGTPHGGVIAELAARCMVVQAISALQCSEAPWLATSHHLFRRRWTRGEPVRWATRVIAVGEEPFGQAPRPTCAIEVDLSMAGKTVTRSTGSFVAAGGNPTPACAGEAVAAYLDALPSCDTLALPVHHAGWSPGRIDGRFETQPASMFFALDEALAAAANTVRGDAFGDEVAEDFLLADLSMTSTGADRGTEPLTYDASIRRGRAGGDGLAEARLLRAGLVIAYGHGRVAFLHRR